MQNHINPTGDTVFRRRTLLAAVWNYDNSHCARFGKFYNCEQSNEREQQQLVSRSLIEVISFPK